MAIPDGKPATDFSAMNREWVRAVAAETAESGGGIPAPENPNNGDVLTYDSAAEKWVAAAPGGGGGGATILTPTVTYDSIAGESEVDYSMTVSDMIALIDSGLVYTKFDNEIVEYDTSDTPVWTVRATKYMLMSYKICYEDDAPVRYDIIINTGENIIDENFTALTDTVVIIYQE